LTIETADGYSITLTHLGSVVVATGAEVAEGDQVGTIGPSGTVETDVPYVHFGIRITSDPNGYVDPLSLLPTLSGTGGSESGSTVPQPSAGGGSSSSTAPVSAPAPAPAATAPAASSQGSTAQASPAPTSRHERSRGQGSRPKAQPHQHSSKRSPVSHPAATERRVPHRPRMPHRRVSEPVSASRRPVVEAAAPHEPVDLDAGHELRPKVGEPRVELQPREDPSVLPGLVCNGVAALVAVGAALAAARRRRHGLTLTEAGAQVLHLPRPTLHRNVRRAA
jgi:pyruvate/2-oxoglutarate dehydrogenase complex dihydrolipoamide acyltransferase (E2) component